MNNHTTNFDQQPEMNELMAAFNPEPPKAEQPVRFYWQDPCEGRDCEPIQETFEA